VECCVLAVHMLGIVYVEAVCVSTVIKEFKDPLFMCVSKSKLFLDWCL